MNAAVRAVTRQALYHGLKVTGISRGYAGLIEGEFRELDTRSVSDIIQRGGTILAQHAVRIFFAKKAGLKLCSK
jgi:6-phosphofructokinase 1